MIKLFQKSETEKYTIIKILFIKITFKKKPPKSNIDNIVWWIPFRSLRDSIRNIYYELKNDSNRIIFDKFNRISQNQIDIHNSIKNMFLANSIHTKTFSKYLNINLNKDIVLIATGPTLNNYTPIKNCVNVGVNHAFQYNKVDLDYLFIQDRKALTANELKDSSKYRVNECIKFYGITSDIDGEIMIPKNIYANGDCNIYIVERAATAFEYFNWDISILPMPSFGSIAFAALNFIAWTHPKRIFLVGCDCSKGGHFADNKDTAHYGYMLYGWNKAKLFLSYHYPDIEVISINPVGLKGMFKDIYAKDGKYIDDNGKEFIF